MAFFEVVVVSGGDDEGAGRAAQAVRDRTPAGTADVRVVPTLEALATPAAEFLVVLEPGAGLVTEWYLATIAALDAEPDRVHTPPMPWAPGAAGACVSRAFTTRADWRALIGAHLDATRNPVVPEPVTSGPVVSVFLPTFNRRRLLARALDCLTEQTYRDIEVVVVNDGGLDPSSVVRSYEDRLNLRLVTQPANYGRSRAYNRAIAEASGRWMMGLADDDTVQPHHIATLVGHALASGAQGPILTYGPAWLVYEDLDGNEVERHILLAGERHRAFLMVENFVFAETSLFERELALELGGFDDRLEVLEDWEFWIRLAQRSTLVRVMTPSTDYRVRGGIVENSCLTHGPARFFNTQQAIYERYPVPAGSWLERLRVAKLNNLRPQQEGQHAFDHTIAVVGNGDVEALVRCLHSIAALAQRERVQLIVHELRTPATEEVLDCLDGQVICLSDAYDPDHAVARIGRQAGGRQVHVIASNELVS